MAANLRRVAETTADGSATTVGLLYECYSRRILAYCLHALCDRSEAEDAVQTTFLHAQRALQRGVVPEHEFAWLHTIAKNVCRTQQRTAVRRGVVVGVDLDTYPAFGDAADQRELRRALGVALASLPEAQRRALVMREWQGLPSAEVAARMGMSTPATYALLTRARRSLERALTTVKGRSALGVNVWPLLARLKAMFAGGTAKVATATAIGVAVAAGGATTQWALADRPKGPVLDEQHAHGSETATPAVARAEHGFEPMVSALRRRAASRAVTPSPRVGVPTQPSDQSVPADAPTAAEPPASPATSTEPPAAAETLPAAEDVLEAALDPVPEFPLPKVDIDIPGVTEIVPDDPLAPIDDAGLPEPPVHGVPLPGPSPLSGLPPLASR